MPFSDSDMKHPYEHEQAKYGHYERRSSAPLSEDLPYTRRPGFFRRLLTCTCFEFDDSDPVRRYRAKHEQIYGPARIVSGSGGGGAGGLEPTQPQIAGLEPESQPPNGSFAGGTTGGSGAGGASC